MGASRRKENIVGRADVSIPEGEPLMGGLPSARSVGCYCTGECKISNPCHPCNGGIAGRPLQQGWTCPTCSNTWAPWVIKCPTCAPKLIPAGPVGDCGCAPNSICNNTACPRRIVVTCES